jgi:ribulose-phosphate 3-epimerase
MVKIAPSILAADFARLGDEIKNAEKLADMIHLDIMDGHFVPNLSFGKAVSKMSKEVTSLPHDAHLMVTDPELYISEFASIGVEYITFHLEIDGIKKELGRNRWVYIINQLENDSRIRKIINDIKAAGCKTGLALNPPTDFRLAVPLMPDIDLLLLMSVNPGFAGQDFMPIFNKIENAAEFRNLSGLKFEIMVDGGVGQDNAEKLIEAGADILVSGSSFFKSSEFQEFIRKLKS